MNSFFSFLLDWLPPPGYRLASSSSSLIPFRFRIFHSWHCPTLCPFPTFPRPSSSSSCFAWPGQPLLIQFDATFIHLFSVCHFYSVLTSTLITLLHAGLALRSRIYISFFTRLAWSTLRIRNADCLRCKQCDNVVAPWGAGISIRIRISISIIEPKVKSELTSATDAISGAINTFFLSLPTFPSVFSSLMRKKPLLGKRKK